MYFILELQNNLSTEDIKTSIHDLPSIVVIATAEKKPGSAYSNSRQQ
jgi:hypothetical protein